jgi:hypothetical protein
MRVLPGDLGRPAEAGGERLVEFRFTNAQGVTEAWMIPANLLSWDELSKMVKLAYLDRGVDLRLAHQKASIDRLLDHVQFHHKGFQGVFPCGWSEDAAPTSA